MPETYIKLAPIPYPSETTVWACPDCDEVATEQPELDKLYECNNCSGKFLGSNGGGKNGNMCPDCGNKFGTRIDEGDPKLGATICPSCREAVAEETQMETCPFCEWHGESPDERNADAFLKHVVEDHLEELSYDVVREEQAV